MAGAREPKQRRQPGLGADLRIDPLCELGDPDEIFFDAVQALGAIFSSVNLHGFARFTKHLDPLLDLEPQNALHGMQALAGCGLRPRVPVALEDFADPAKREDWATNRNMLVFQVWDPGDPFCTVDVFVRNPIEFDGLWARAVVERIGEVPCRIASIDDLIATKRMAGRPQDLSDVESLEQIQRLREHPP